VSPKVIALKSGDTAQGSDGRIQIDVDGAIETLRKSGKAHIMEGGKAAFDLRNWKYTFGTIAD
jgi:hypothetical protein